MKKFALTDSLFTMQHFYIDFFFQFRIFLLVQLRYFTSFATFCKLVLKSILYYSERICSRIKERIFTQGFKKMGFRTNLNWFFIWRGSLGLTGVAHVWGTEWAGSQVWEQALILDAQWTSRAGDGGLQRHHVFIKRLLGAQSSTFRYAPDLLPPIAQALISALTVLEAPLHPFAGSHDFLERVASITHITAELAVFMRHATGTCFSIFSLPVRACREQCTRLPSFWFHSMAGVAARAL